MTAAPPIPPPPTVHRDVPCVSCGYCLRGLRVDGRCPECGTAVSASLGIGPARRRRRRQVARWVGLGAAACGGLVALCFLMTRPLPPPPPPPVVVKPPPPPLRMVTRTDEAGGLKLRMTLPEKDVAEYERILEDFRLYAKLEPGRFYHLAKQRMRNGSGWDDLMKLRQDIDEAL